MKNLLFTLSLALLLVNCKSPEARLPESVQTGSFIKASTERNIKLNESERSKIKAIIEKNPDTEYIASESGFWYFYQSRIEQDTIKPAFGDRINFNYNVSNLDGSLIYSEEQLGSQNYTMDKEELFSGLREGLKLMKPSERVTFLFPSQLAYGYYGDDNKIGTNIILICEVKLNTVIQNKNE